MTTTEVGNWAQVKAAVAEALAPAAPKTKLKRKRTGRRV